MKHLSRKQKHTQFTYATGRFWHDIPKPPALLELQQTRKRCHTQDDHMLGAGVYGL